MNSIPNSLSEFRELVETIDWFGQIGQPSEYEHRIKTPEEWPGPEDPTVMPLGLWEQEIFENLSTSEHAAGAFEEIRSLTSSLTQTRIPYRADGDVWEWPNFAVALAGWTAGLVAMHIVSDEPLLKDLETQWNWFVSGRLPCAYVVKGKVAAKRFQEFYSEGDPPEGFVAFFEKHPNKFVVF